MSLRNAYENHKQIKQVLSKLTLYKNMPNRRNAESSTVYGVQDGGVHVEDVNVKRKEESGTFRPCETKAHKFWRRGV